MDLKSTKSDHEISSRPQNRRPSELFTTVVGSSMFVASGTSYLSGIPGSTPGNNCCNGVPVATANQATCSNNKNPNHQDYISTDLVEFSDEIIDPRVAVELDSLNSSTNEINKLEKELELANVKFRQLLTSTSGELEALGRRIGSAIDRARPFYEALAQAKDAHRACLSAATQFSRANGLHSAAKATVAHTESKFDSNNLDSVFQEVLNHATMKVMEAEKMKKDSELAHRLCAEEFTRAESKVHELEKHLNREIEKARPYFELKDALNVNLSRVKTEIESLQSSIAVAKKTYAESLRRLETISEEIHQRRRMTIKNGLNHGRDNTNGFNSTSISGAPMSSSRSTSSSSTASAPSTLDSPDLSDHYALLAQETSSLSSESVDTTPEEDENPESHVQAQKGRRPLPKRISPIGAETNVSETEVAAI